MFFYDYIIMINEYRFRSAVDSVQRKRRHTASHYNLILRSVHLHVLCYDMTYLQQDPIGGA